ncbi:MAG: preprotein translocase subunit SecE [Candidatus Eremiobacteraeota bacterium]|nr:preprotein translocase subunit SecE [Candidatus Eremiobacteraeota bacterium]
MINKPTGGAGTRGGGNNKNGAGRTVAVTRRAGGQSPQEFVRGVFLEMRRVTWPSREEWISATVLTILLVVGIGLFTFTVDWLFGLLFQSIHPGA